jgi:hypothetical protein
MRKVFYISLLFVVLSVPAIAKGCHLGGHWSTDNNPFQHFSTNYGEEDTLYIPYQDSVHIQLYWTDCTSYDLPGIFINSILDPQSIRHSSVSGDYYFTTPGEYQIQEFISTNYYGLRAKFYVAFLPSPVTTSVPETSINTLTVFPNPFHDFLTAKVGDGNTEELQFRIFSLDGRMILEHTYNEISSCTLFTSELAPGIYIVEIRTKENTFRQKFLKT